MASAATHLENGLLRSEPSRPDRGYRRVLLEYGLLSSFLFTLAVWLFTHGYHNELAVRSWTKILGVLDAPQTRLEYLSLAYPHLPLYLLIPFRYLPGLDTPLAPVILAVLLVSGLLVYWYRQLAKGALHQPYRILALGFLLANPFILWSSTSSGAHALAFVLYYILCVSMARLVITHDIRSFMLLGCTMALLFFADERTPFLVIAVAPLLPLLLPPVILQRRAASAYLVIFLPVIFSVLGWIYLNWMFFREPWQWLTLPDSAFRGAWAEIMSYTWLRDHGGQFFRPLVLASGFAALLVPWLIGLLCSLRPMTPQWRACLVMTVVPIIATALATADSFLAHPFLMLFLLVPAMMAALASWPQITNRRPVLLIAGLGLSAVLSWGSMFWFSSPDFANWTSALSGQTIPPDREADERLGAWLAAHRDPTLLDSRLAAWVIAARGDAQGLRLQFTREFRLNLLGQLTAPQLVIPDPTTGLGASDLLNRRYPTLFAQGWPGYRLLYYDAPWRVYHRD